ncbi:MAG: diguanylate cyclase [Desulfovibrio sp.]|uniref:diguanylate cyclase domain-containing protein n=1 Tax=Desulfovibrio sp. TaxID=885 RepID=UPI0039E6428C
MVTEHPYPYFAALCRTARALADVDAVWIDLDDRFWLDTASNCGGTAEMFKDSAAQIRELSAENTPLLLVPDTRKAPALCHLPCVAGKPGLRFVAAVRFANGAGRLVLCGMQPSAVREDFFARLQDLAQLADQYYEQVHAAEEAARRAALFRLLAETSTDTIIHGDLDGVRRYVSPSVRDLLGYEPEELLGKRAVDITHPDDLPQFGELMRQVHEGALDVGVRELRQRHKDGSWVWMEASLRLTHEPATGKPDGYVVSVRGVGRRKRLETKLKRLANYDALTGLPNRIFFEQQLHKAVTKARADASDLALFYMDLDGFKNVNDTLGHQAGDTVLREAALRFRRVMRPADSVARVGGDEFTALLEVSPDQAKLLAQRLIEAVSKPFPCQKGDVSVGLSIGIACMSTALQTTGLDEEELLSRADAAMYEAKAAGRNTFILYVPSGK